jgi:cellulase/cellobiase CelA1
VVQWQILAEALTLADFSGEWLHEQLADLIEHAQGGVQRVISSPVLRGVAVGIVAYTDEQGLILMLRYDPLFHATGAAIAGGWDEPSAFIPYATGTISPTSPGCSPSWSNERTHSSACVPPRSVTDVRFRHRDG